MTNLLESLERRAERGPHRAPAEVIAAARAATPATAGPDNVIELEPLLDAPRPRRIRPARFAAAALCVAAVGATVVDWNVRQRTIVPAPSADRSVP